MEELMKRAFGEMRVSLDTGLRVWPSHAVWSVLLAFGIAVDVKERGLTKYIPRLLPPGRTPGPSLSPQDSSSWEAGEAAAVVYRREKSLLPWVGAPAFFGTNLPFPKSREDDTV